MHVCSKTLFFEQQPEYSRGTTYNIHFNKYMHICVDAHITKLSHASEANRERQAGYGNMERVSNPRKDFARFWEQYVPGGARTTTVSRPLMREAGGLCPRRKAGSRGFRGLGFAACCAGTGAFSRTSGLGRGHEIASRA